MRDAYKYPDDPNDAERDLQLEALRVRDRLGMDNSSAPRAERVLAAARNRIEEEVDVEQPSHPVSSAPRATRPVQRRRASVWFALAAGVALVVVALTTWPVSPASAGPPFLAYGQLKPEDSASAPAAHETLTKLAAAALRNPTQGRGPVSYLKSYGWMSQGAAGGTWTEPFREQVWVGADGSTLMVQDLGAAITRDGKLDPTAAQTFSGLSRETLPAGTFAVPALGDNPEDYLVQWQTTLTPEVREDDDMRAYFLMDEVRALATLRVLEPEELSSLWAALAHEPGVRTLGHVTDRLGRDCVALASMPFVWGSDTWVDVLLVDPETGRLVGTEEVTLVSESRNVQDPTVTGFRVITDAQMVSEVGAVP